MEVPEHASCHCHGLSSGTAPKKLSTSCRTLAGQVVRASFDGYRCDGEGGEWSLSGYWSFIITQFGFLV